MQVYLNDSNTPMEYDGENMIYNKYTGELTIAASPANLYSAFVTMAFESGYMTSDVTPLSEEETKSKVASMKTYPYMTGDGDFTFNDSFYYSANLSYILVDWDNVENNTIPEFQGEIIDRTAPYCYTGIADERSQSALYNWINWGGATMNQYLALNGGLGTRDTATTTAEKLIYNFTVSQPSLLEGKSYTTDGGKQLTFTTRQAGNPIVANDTSCFALRCSHNVDGILGGLHVSDDEKTGYVTTQAFIRILYVNTDDADNSYAVIGVLSPGEYSQSGAGIYKIKIEPNRDEGEVKLNIKKTDASNPNKVVAGAKYTVYTTQDCTTPAKDDFGQSVLTTTRYGSNTLTYTLLGEELKAKKKVVYVKETESPPGYDLDTTVYKVEINDGETYTLQVKDSGPPPEGQSGYKTSSNPTITDGNRCYSLEGAVYQITCDFAGQCNVNGTTVKTDADGNVLPGTAHQHYVQVGDAYQWQPATNSGHVQEITAPPGYALCKEQHPCTIYSDGSVDFTCSDDPLVDSFALKINKMDQDTGKGTPLGTASFEGAQFQVSYYDNLDGSTSSSPKKTWVFETDVPGKIDLSDSSYLVSGTLYKDPDTGKPIYPLGTYLVKEIRPPKYYQNSGTMSFTNPEISGSASVTKGLVLKIVEVNDTAQVQYENVMISEVNLSINVYDYVYRGSVNIVKYDSDGETPLAGVSFKLVCDDGTEYTGKTDSSGSLVFDRLIPEHYTLTETSTVDGRTLLKDNIELDIPLALTNSEVVQQGANRNKAVWDEVAGKWCFYSLSYDIKNDIIPVLPMTGGNPGLLYAGFTAAFAAIGYSGYTMIKRRRRKTK